MDDEKFDLNSRIWVWFNSVLSYDNIIAHDFLNEIDGCATFADVIIGLADRCPLSDFLGDTLILPSCSSPWRTIPPMPRSNSSGSIRGLTQADARLSPRFSTP